MPEFGPAPPPFSCPPEAAQAFSPLDIHFAAYIRRTARNLPETEKAGRPADEAAALAAALLCRSQRLGHIRLDLSQPVPSAVSPGEEASDIPLEELLSPLPDPAVWADQLRRSGIAGNPGEAFPLILDDESHLYLWRYHRYEQALAAFIRSAASYHDGDNAADQDAESLIQLDAEQMDEAIARLFPNRNVSASGQNDPDNTSEEDRQALAAVSAARRKFLVISGGPGTGKTHTVAAILALLMELEDLPPERIALAAPTGKAAARISASIRAAAARLNSPAADRIPSNAVTLHRLLGVRPDSPQFRRNADHPLPADLIVVDEASMVDLALMAKLTTAIRPGARLILLGDKHQLASVEAGSVLGDICDSREPAVAAGVVELTRNYRFGRDSGIGRLARFVTGGHGDAAIRLLFEEQPPDCHLSPAAENLEDRIRRAAREIIIPELLRPDRAELDENESVNGKKGKKDKKGKKKNGDAGKAGAATDMGTLPERLARLDRFRILCALRKGPCGVMAVNRLMEEILAREGAIRPPDADGWYAGRPVLVLRNDYQSGLFNGDTGLTVADPRREGRLAVCFPDGNGGIRLIPTLRMPACETVFAMTAHKSQGSEFDRVLLILPDRDSPVLTRELLYTGITRAARHLEIRAEAEILRLAVERPVQRDSGLKQAIERS